MARLKSSNAVSATASLNLHTTEALYFVKEALFDACQEVIAVDAVEGAKELAPVLPKATTERTPGELRDSIDATVRHDKKGVRARITTSCGFGGYVELGTQKAQAEPYIYPAFETNIQKLPQAVKDNLETYTTGGKVG